MLRLGESDYKVMPWKNGGGVTTEIAVHPEGSGLAHFDWRISIADVAVDGPFSKFPGYERTIMLLTGGGMVLDAGSHGRIELREAFQPRSFSGDWEIHGRLLRGPVRDFNLMVKTGRVSGELKVMSITGRLAFTAPKGGVLLAHVLRGNLTEAGKGETLIAEHDFSIAQASPDPATVALVTIAPVAR